MENSRISPESRVNQGSKPVQTDAAEIVRRHLEDENHEITEDEMRNVKIATTDDEPVTLGAEAAARLLDDKSEPAGDEMDNDKDEEDPKGKPGTPWDILSE